MTEDIREIDGKNVLLTGNYARRRLEAQLEENQAKLEELKNARVRAIERKRAALDKGGVPPEKWGC